MGANVLTNPRRHSKVRAVSLDLDLAIFWMPKSQIDDSSDVQHLLNEGDLIVSEWIAIEKGWV